MRDRRKNRDDVAFMIVNARGLGGALDTMPPTNGLEILTTQELTQSDARLHPGVRICITADTELDDVMSRLEDETRLFAIRNLRDKFAFRQLLSAEYPKIKFRRIRLSDLPNETNRSASTYVLKPVKGCFGTGVRTITPGTNAPLLVREIQHELARNNNVLARLAADPEDFLIETFVHGEEYAVDMFYDEQAQPVITNIYHHPMPRNRAYLHMLYYSSREVFNLIYQPAMEFFAMLNDHLKVRAFPIHAEFKLNEGGLVPVELNPLRFGGAGLANLGFYAFGLNAYQCFVDDRRPDWERIWRKERDMAYGFFIAYNGAHIDVTTHTPDWDRLRTLFSQILVEVPFNYQKQLAFGVLYIADKVPALLELLQIEFDDYFVALEEAHG
jgi:hypothetical protein